MTGVYREGVRRGERGGFPSGRTSESVKTVTKEIADAGGRAYAKVVDEVICSQRRSDPG